MVFGIGVLIGVVVYEFFGDVVVEGGIVVIGVGFIVGVVVFMVFDYVVFKRGVL